MDPIYARYALTDPLFYDDPARRPAARRHPLRPDSTRNWSGWDRTDDGQWIGWHPRGATLPDQGWKIHVSATPTQVADTLRLVSAHCHGAGLVFKHVPGRDELAARHGKEADRAAAGKAITIYPPDEPTLHRTLLALDALVGGRPGPYVLSDLRWARGPLYVRYGAFTRAWTRDADGEQVPALRDPAGALVPDRRGPGFTPPPWVDLPDFLQEAAAALADTGAPADFGHTITGVLHYSNAGGVYRATAADGRAVVLKEGRPHAGLTPDGRDAGARLADEERALRAVAGPGVVEVRGSLQLHGHRFLALAEVPGQPLNAAVVARCPTIRADSTPDDRLAYRGWALGVAAQLTAVLDRIHAAGWAHGDLHPRNVLLTPDDEVVLLDFEMRHPVDRPRPTVIGAPGFVPPDGRTGVAADRYALACLVLFLFCPLTPLLALDPLKVDELLADARDEFGLDPALLAGLRRDLDLPGRERLGSASVLARVADGTLRGWEVESEDAVVAIQVMIARSLEAAADYSRADRLWPGDPRQHTEPGYGLAHGAAGVVHALDRCSLDVDPQARDWLTAATETDLAAAAPRFGLWDGLAGAGWAARRRGEHDLADRILDRVVDRVRTRRAADRVPLGPQLAGGWAGIGLYLIAESPRDPVLLADAEALLRLVDDQPTTGTGLLRGAAGVGLFALRLAEATGDRSALDRAVAAVDRDLHRCTLAVDGSLQVDEGWRLMPYLGAGSAGVGLVAAQLVPLLADPEPQLRALDAITAAARTPFVIEPGLMQGRAGLIHYLVLLSRLGLADDAAERALDRHVRALRLHALRHRTGIAFPGQGLLRISCDLATGAAGVLTALQAFTMLRHDETRPGWPELLPLLLPPTIPARATVPGPTHQGGR